jgi:hypothetical protein
MAQQRGETAADVVDDRGDLLIGEATGGQLSGQTLAKVGRDWHE